MASAGPSPGQAVRERKLGRPREPGRARAVLGPLARRGAAALGGGARREQAHRPRPAAAWGRGRPGAAPGEPRRLAQQPLEQARTPGPARGRRAAGLHRQARRGARARRARPGQAQRLRVASKARRCRTRRRAAAASMPSSSRCGSTRRAPPGGERVLQVGRAQQPRQVGRVERREGHSQARRGPPRSSGSGPAMRRRCRGPPPEGGRGLAGRPRPTRPRSARRAVAPPRAWAVHDAQAGGVGDGQLEPVRGSPAAAPLELAAPLGVGLGGERERPERRAASGPRPERQPQGSSRGRLGRRSRPAQVALDREARERPGRGPPAAAAGLEGGDGSPRRTAGVLLVGRGAGAPGGTPPAAGAVLVEVQGGGAHMAILGPWSAPP